MSAERAANQRRRSGKGRQIYGGGGERSQVKLATQKGRCK